jgi:hypothetical protein
MSKRTQPKDIKIALKTADTACELAYLAYQQADEWCRALSRGWHQLLDQHTAIGKLLEAGARRMGQGDEPACDMDGLWAQAKTLMDELDAMMACRRAASRQAHAASRAHEAATRKWYRLMAAAECASAGVPELVYVDNGPSFSAGRVA